MKKRAFFFLTILLIISASTAQRQMQDRASVTQLALLPPELSESSGAIMYDGRIWTHNDSGGKPEVTAIDPTTGKETARILLTNATNTDWEDITQDSLYIYIADTGNNSGGRKKLQIYRILKSAIDANGGFQLAKSEALEYQYDYQPGFLLPYFHNYDCEAIATVKGQIFLFSKSWASRNCNIYILDEEKKLAVKTDSIATNGLITGADYSEEDDRLVLCGYNFDLQVLKPFIIEISDFTKPNRSMKTWHLPLNEHQVEGICLDNRRIIITNEETQNIDGKKFPAAIFEVFIEQKD